jgi:hypothetical protein
MRSVRSVWPMGMKATALTHVLYNIVNTQRNTQGNIITVWYGVQRPGVSVTHWVLMRCGKIHIASIFKVEASRVLKWKVI